MIALSTVLSMIQIPLMPHGGFHHPVQHGAHSGNELPPRRKVGRHDRFRQQPDPACAGPWQSGILPDPLTAQVGCVLLDYLLAFTVLGFACLIAKPFRSRTVGVGVSAFVVCLLRFFVQLSVRLHRLEGLRLRFQLDDRDRLSRHLPT